MADRFQISQRKPVAFWFRSVPNSKIIEILPEESFRVGMIMKIEAVVVPAFMILVNELAIDYAADNPSSTTDKWRAFSGRKRADLGDVDQDSIQHAARAYAERMKGALERLFSDSLFDELGVNEWQRVQLAHGDATDTPAPLASAWRSLKSGLLYAWRRGVRRLLIQRMPDVCVSAVEDQRKHYIEEDDGRRLPMPTIVDSLNERQKAMMPIFWFRLKQDTPYFAMNYVSGDKAGTALETLVDRYNAAVDKAQGLDRRTSNALPLLARVGADDDDNTRFSLFRFRHELDTLVEDLCKSMLDRSHTSNFNFLVSDHLLLNLQHDELKFLPDWTEMGEDDGSGAVFQSEVPPAAMGPSEPGPGYHTGRTVATDASSSSVVDLGQELDDLVLVTGSDTDTIGPESVQARHGTTVSAAGTHTDDGYCIVAPEGSDYSLV
jgi:hypothetical protein